MSYYFIGSVRLYVHSKKFRDHAFKKTCWKVMYMYSVYILYVNAFVDMIAIFQSVFSCSTDKNDICHTQLLI